MNDIGAGGGRLDFSAIRADNPIADVVGRYVELRRRGGELVGRCPFHADRNPSFAVVPAKGKAFCNACGWHGDVVDFVAEFENIDPPEAARRLGGGQLPTDRPPPPPLPPDEAADWLPVLPAPDDAPAYDPAKTYNPRRGKVVDWSRIKTRQDAYRDAAGRLLGYVMRLEIDGEKLTPAVTWARHADGRACWASVKFPEPRPLQGLDELAHRPTAPVLVVEGEKSRAAGAKILPGFVVVTWPGGTNAVDKADWSPLAGRNVTLWPDADPGGRVAADEVGSRSGAHTVRILDVSDLEAEFGKGADVADLVAAGWTTARVVAWARDRVRPWSPPAPNEKPAKRPAAEKAAPPGIEGEIDAPAGGTAPEAPPVDQPATSDAPSATPDRAPRREKPSRPVNGTVVDLPPAPNGAYESLTTWSALGLALSDKGVPVANLDNAARLLEKHPEVAGRFWFDEFLQRILTTWTGDGEAREWADADDVRLALWMQRKMGIGRMAVGTARDAVTAVAMAHTRNEAREWLESLTWDGTPRLGALIPAGFGAEDNVYTQAVGRCWLVSMAARVLNPGCKVDTMPVFEGAQGKRKSTALQVLVSARWFAEASESPTSKDFFQALTGKLLVEIGEMDSFSRAEVHTIKRVISCQSDRYRAPYGRRAEDHARMGVFAGTTNKDDWNRDETGARRFWPIKCERELDIAWILEHRAQLFAEAVERYLRGESWWDVPVDDAMREQEARRDSDEWESIIDTWLVGKWETTVGDVLGGALKLEPDRWERALQMRVGRALRVLGWAKADVRRGGRVVKVWRAPDAGNDNGPLL